MGYKKESLYIYVVRNSAYIHVGTGHYEFGGRYKKCPNGLNAPGAVPRSSALYLFIFLVGGKNSHLISFTKNQKPL